MTEIWVCKEIISNNHSTHFICSLQKINLVNSCLIRVSCIKSNYHGSWVCGLEYLWKWKIIKQYLFCPKKWPPWSKPGLLIQENGTTLATYIFSHQISFWLDDKRNEIITSGLSNVQMSQELLRPTSRLLVSMIKWSLLYGGVRSVEWRIRKNKPVSAGIHILTKPQIC